MKFTMYNYTTELVLERGIERTAEYAASLGFSAVEFLEFAKVPVKSKQEARQIREALRARGLSVSCYSMGMTLFGSEEEEKKLLSRLEVIAELGSPLLHHTLALPYQPIDGRSFDEVMADVLPRALRVAERARELGVRCIYEEQGYYFNGVRNFGTFYEKIKQYSDNVGVCGDFGNILFSGDRSADFIKTFAKEIKHVHLKDYIPTDTPIPGDACVEYGEGKYLLETTLGDGIVNAEACLQSLRDAGYDGQFAFEINAAFPEEFETVIRQNMDYLERSKIFD